AVAGGAGGGPGAGTGSAWASGILLPFGSNPEIINFAPPQGQTLSITDDILDEQVGYGSLVMSGGGNTAFDPAHLFEGNFTVSAGTLELGQNVLVPTDTVTLAGSLATVRFDATSFPFAPSVAGFGSGDAIDFAGVPYARGGTPQLTGVLLQIKDIFQ